MNLDSGLPQVERDSVPLSTLLDSHEFATELIIPSRTDCAAQPGTLEEIRSRPVAAPTVIELEDPRKYLLPHDLLLITGLGLPKSAADTDEYVSRLMKAGVPALVFGVEPVYSEVPELLINACKEQHLPLIALPPEVAFAQVVSLLSRALEEQRTRALSEMNTVARRLTEAALQHRPTRRLLDVLSNTSSGWALLRTDSGIQESGNKPSGSNPDQILEAIDARFANSPASQSGSLTANYTFQHNEQYYGVAAYEVMVHSTRRTRTSIKTPVLVLVVPERLSRTDRTAILLAVNLLRLIVSIPADQSTALDQLLMYLLAEASPPDVLRRAQGKYARLISTALGVGRRKEAFAVVATHHSSYGPGPTSASDAAWLRRFLRTPLADYQKECVRAFIGRIPSSSSLERAAELGWSFAISSVHSVEGLPNAMREAEDLAEISRHTGQHQLGYAETPNDDVFLADSLPASAGFAERILAPLLSPAQEDARKALHTWLLHNGSWEQSARALGLHRNSVRRLVSDAGQQLHRNMDDPVQRAKVLLAFSALEQ